MSNRIIIFIAVPILALAGLGAWFLMKDSDSVDDFTACVAAGNPVAESYPRQCTSNGKTYVEDITQTASDYAEYTSEKGDTVRLVSPKAADEVSSPLTITGAVRGNWSFEGSFPISLINSAGTVVASGIATLQGDWMTTNFVTFTATLTYSTTPTGIGSLHLQKDNPSGEADKDDSVDVPITFGN